MLLLETTSEIIYRFRANFGVNSFIKTGGDKAIKDDHQGVEGVDDAGENFDTANMPTAGLVLILLNM